MNGFVPYMDPGVDQVDVAMRPRNYRQGSRADVPQRRGSISLTFSGVVQVDVAMRPRNSRQGSRADVPQRRGSITLTFSGVVPAMTIRGHVSIFRHQPEGIS